MITSRYGEALILAEVLHRNHRRNENRFLMIFDDVYGSAEQARILRLVHCRPRCNRLSDHLFQLLGLIMA